MHHTTLSKLSKNIKKQIISCVNCQPWDGGVPIWLGKHIKISDFSGDTELSESEWRTLLEGLRCPQCGAKFEGPSDEVQIYSLIDYEIDRIFDRISDRQTTNSLKNFSNFISAYPYLGSHNSLGEKLFKAVQNGQQYAIDARQKWYRARLINHESRMFHSYEMGAPNPAKIVLPEGRFNHGGQAFLYLSNEKETAHREINDLFDGLTIIQKFQLSDIKKILDLRKDYSIVSPNTDIIFLAIIYNGYIAKVPQKSSSWKPEYFVTRYLADVARFFKYEGIIFSSTVHEGSNLVLFNPRHRKVKAVGKPFVYKKKTNAKDVNDVPF
jgi:hypothetical protein